MAQWNIDNAHSAADFTVRHMMVTNVRGTFAELSAVTILTQRISPKPVLRRQSMLPVSTPV
jgi:polyisoprenoid-binding protein YceI